VGVAQPALESAFAGTGDLILFEHHADQARAPLGMLLTQTHGGLISGLARGRPRGRSPRVVTSQTLDASLTHTLHQVADGPPV
jgi:hypothetical protein